MKKSYTNQENILSAPAFLAGADGFSPIYTWAWNVPVTREGIRVRIDGMKKAGILAFYILPLPPEFRPTWMITSLTPAYLSDEFFDLVRYAVAYAAEQGMRCWLYDEGGWPSGGACGQVTKALPDTVRKTVASRPVTLGAGEAYKPAGDAVATFYDRRRIASGERFDTPITLFECYVKEEFSHMFADFYDPRAVEKFLDLTHRRYAERLGDALADIPCMFIDEPSGDANAYSPYISRRFAEEYGYPLEDHLYLLLETEGLSPAEEQVRQDYAALLAALFEESLARIRAELQKMGMLLVGHLDNDHVAEGAVRNGYGNFMRGLRALDIPGVDEINGHILPYHTPSTPLFFPRLASSAAAQRGGRYALTESCTLHGNSLSTDDIRYILNAQLVRGINVFNLMLMPYETDGAYAYGQRPFFSPSIPGFGHLGALNRELARECYFMTCGTHAPCAALFYPHTDLWRGKETATVVARAYEDAGRALEAAGVDFDIADADILAAATVEDGALVCGLARYTEIYLPEGATLSPALAEKLAPFLRTALPTGGDGLLRRVMRDGQGNVYFCYFNPHGGGYNAKIAPETDLPLYRFDPQSGCVSRFEKGTTYAFEHGECLLLFATQEDLTTAAEEKETASLVLTPCRATVERRMQADETGVRLLPDGRELPPADFATMLGVDFSGEVAYEYRFTLAFPQAARLTVTGLVSSAAVTLNGQSVGHLTTSPYALRLPQAALRAGENILTLTVANLAANAYAAAEELAAMHFSKAELGPYHPMALVYEKQAAGGGITGEVRLSLLAE